MQYFCNAAVHISRSWSLELGKYFCNTHECWGVFGAWGGIGGGRVVGGWELNVPLFLLLTFGRTFVASGLELSPRLPPRLPTFKRHLPLT